MYFIFNIQIKKYWFSNIDIHHHIVTNVGVVITPQLLSLADIKIYPSFPQ